MKLAGFADAGLVTLAAASPRKGGCCGGCDEAEAHGQKTPCEEAAERAALVAGITDELAVAKWFIENRWTLIGASFAAGGLFFATVSYFANRNPS